MSAPNFTPSELARLSSIDLDAAIRSYEVIAQSFFDKARNYEGKPHFVALVVRLNYQGQENLDKADALRIVLAVRRAKHQQKQRFVAKCLEIQPLAHAALEGVRP